MSYWGHRQLAATAALAAFRGVDLAAGRALGIAFARPAGETKLIWCSIAHSEQKVGAVKWRIMSAVAACSWEGIDLHGGTVFDFFFQKF